MMDEYEQQRAYQRGKDDGCFMMLLIVGALFFFGCIKCNDNRPTTQTTTTVSP